MAKQRYSKEFKLEVLRLLDQPNASVRSVAQDLGVNENSIYAWKKKFGDQGDDAFPGQGNRSEEQKEIAKLKRELKQAKEDLEILTEATRFFALLGKSKR